MTWISSVLSDILPLIMQPNEVRMPHKPILMYCLDPFSKGAFKHVYEAMVTEGFRVWGFGAYRCSIEIIAP